MNSKAVLAPSPSRNGKVIEILEEKCKGCNRCVEACRSDVFIPNLKKGKPPIVFYPEECWYCGCCIQECKHGAIRLLLPLYQRIAINWKDKATGEINYVKINKKKGG
jgi:NAD-dependent dihydropyrimidine dehydrogenase PreA subunit